MTILEFMVVALIAWWVIRFVIRCILGIMRIVLWSAAIGAFVLYVLPRLVTP